MTWIVALLACGGAPEFVPAPEPVAEPGPSPEEAALADAERLATEAAQKLQARMVQEMGAHGPPKAVEVCSMEADQITRSVVEPDTEARVGRSSLKLRNPANAAPDWVQAWLDAQGDRPFAEAEGFARVDDGPDGRVARVLRPLPVQERCLACHGPADEIAASVKAVLDERYPGDAAHGYATGDLRGALWAEVAVGG